MADSSEESWITRYIEATVQDILNFISTGDVPRMQIKSVCTRSLGVTCKEMLLALMVAGRYEEPPQCFQLASYKC